MEIRAVILSEKDNVAVLTQHAEKGDVILAGDCRITAQESIPTGHKMAIRAISGGEGIYKYGAVIGRATCDISVGQWVHCHNVEDITEQLCNEYAVQYRAKAKEAKRNG